MEKKRLKKTKVKRKKRVVRHANQRYYVGKDLNKPPPITMTTHIHNYGMRKYLDPNPRMLLERHVNSARIQQTTRETPPSVSATSTPMPTREQQQRPRMTPLPELEERPLRSDDFYDGMSKDDLMRILTNRKIPFKKRWKKRDLIQALKDSDV